LQQEADHVGAATLTRTPAIELCAMIFAWTPSWCMCGATEKIVAALPNLQPPV
jgi:hypothetical protein